jgi:hypothetical protein
VLAKKTSKNQVTLPKKVVDQFPGIDYFEVRTGGGAIHLYPVDVNGASRVRDKLESLGISDRDVQKAVTWARRRRR